MANYYGNGRTNYFNVKEDKKKDLEELADLFNLNFCDSDTGVCLLSNHEDGGFDKWFDEVDLEDCTPEQKKVLKEYCDFDGTEEVEVCITDIIYQFLTDDTVAVFQSVGNEKLRYLTGWVIAVDSTNKCINKSLDLTFEEKQEFKGKKITSCTY
jgi:hypothetical protein